MRGRLRGVRRLAGHPVQALQHVPAGREGRIDLHAAQKGIDCLGCLLQCDMAMTALLVEAAEARMQSFEAGQRGKRRIDIAEQTLRQRAQNQDVAILGHRDQECVSRAQGFGEAPLIDEFARSPNFKLYRRRTVHKLRPGTAQNRRDAQRA